MKSYQLETREQDNDFLGGKEVRCRAVLEKHKEIVNKGDQILVLLSNGKKYKGTIADFHTFSVDSYTVGDLIITRMNA